MYAQVEKSKENKSRAVANYVAQKKNGKLGFGIVDNRPIQRLIMSIGKKGDDVITDATNEMVNRNSLLAVGNLTHIDQKSGYIDKIKEYAKSYKLRKNEDFVIVSHGSPPSKFFMKLMPAKFAGMKGKKLAKTVKDFFPPDYNGEIFLNGCYTGKRRDFKKVGSSYIEKFGKNMKANMPNSTGTIRGNIGAAITKSGNTEINIISKSEYNNLPAELQNGCTTFNGGKEYVVPEVHGQATYDIENGAFISKYAKLKELESTNKKGDIEETQGLLE